MRQVYLDNAATTRHKPKSVLENMNRYFSESGCSPGRGGYEYALMAGREILETRLAVGELFHWTNPEQVVFTLNVTHGLNYAIKGLLRPGDHVVTTSIEHNAVIRPLRTLEKAGIITVTYAPCGDDGSLEPQEIKKALQHNTRLVVINHASNVTGTILPIKEIGDIVDNHEAFFIVDAAQTAGVCEIDFPAMHIDVLGFTGHKSLYGPPGVGGLVVSSSVIGQFTSVIQGGTGSRSELEYQPDFWPDILESGTMNTPGIYGLKAGVEFVQSVGVSVISEHLRSLVHSFRVGLRELPGITVHGPTDPRKQVATVSITADGWDLGEVSFRLADSYGIMTRSGLHCAPIAHKTAGTFPEGTLRFSFSYFNTLSEVEYTLQSLGEILG